MEILKIPNQIITAPLQSINLSKIDSIAVHHMAHPTADIKTVESWHINQGWRALGYNYWVSFDGKVYEGRGLHLGAGVENQNGHIISIGFQGDYHSKKVDMPDAQFNAGIDIINWVLNKIPSIKKIGGHGEYMATACPGKYFPLAEMKTLKKRNSEELTMTQYEELKNLISTITKQNDELKKQNDELKKSVAELKPKYYDWTLACPEWTRPYVQKALDLGILKGDDKKQLRLTDDRIWSLIITLRAEGLMK